MTTRVGPRRVTKRRTWRCPPFQSQSAGLPSRGQGTAHWQTHCMSPAAQQPKPQRVSKAGQHTSPPAATYGWQRVRYSQEQSQIRRCSLVGGNNVVEADAGVAHERGKEGELIAGAGDVRKWMQRPKHQQQNTVRERLAGLVRIDFELGNPASGNYKQPWWRHVRRRVACMKLEARDARTAETGEKRTCRLPKYRTSTTACRSRHSDLSPTPASRLLGWADTLPAKPGHGIRTWKRSGNPSLESSNFWRSSFNMQGTWRYGSGRKSCAHTHSGQHTSTALLPKPASARTRRCEMSPVCNAVCMASNRRDSPSKLLPPRRDREAAGEKSIKVATATSRWASPCDGTRMMSW